MSPANRIRLVEACPIQWRPPAGGLSESVYSAVNSYEVFKLVTSTFTEDETEAPPAGSRIRLAEYTHAADKIIAAQPISGFTHT